MTESSLPAQFAPTNRQCPSIQDSDTVETRLWPDEHFWLYDLMRSRSNTAPCFRFPDLISACVAHIFDQAHPAERVFHFLRTQLIQRDPQTARLRERMWRAQYALLLDLQRAPQNRHPHPKFQLDQFTTTCVALSRLDDESGATVFRFARQNLMLRESALASETST